MSLSRSNCTLLGFGASPPPVDGAVVLGGAASVCYLGGSAPGATVSAAALNLKAGAQLVTAAGAGAAGAPLLSGGAGGAPTWSTTSAFYVYSANSTLAVGTSGQRAILKNSSSGSITVTGTGTGFVVGTAAAVSTLTMAGGASVMLTSNGTNWLQTYQSGPPAPTVTGVSPASGPLAGGTEITITGTGFIGATAVTVGGNLATSVIVNETGTSITAITPPGTGTAGSVNVTAGGITSANNTLYSYTGTLMYSYNDSNQTFIVPQRVTRIRAVVSGSAGGTSSPTVFGGRGAILTGTINVTPGDLLTIVCGAHAYPYAGAGNGSGGGVSAPGGGYSAIIRGAAVDINGKPTGTVPDTVYIMSGGGGGAYARPGFASRAGGDAGGWDRTATPKSQGLNGQGAGSIIGGTGGTTIASDGTGAGGADGGSAFTGGTYTAAVLNYPSGGGGGYYGGGYRTNASVAGGGGSSYISDAVTDYISEVTNTSAGYVQLTYDLAPVPTVTSVSPESGPVNTQITITGTAFTGATLVTVGGVAATSVTVVSDTSITAITPEGLTTGTAVSVNVTTPGGVSIDKALYTYVLVYDYAPSGVNQVFTAPMNGTVTATVAGSSGGWGRGGAVITGTFSVSSGDILTIVVGSYVGTYAGAGSNNQGLSGGGYSAVLTAAALANTNGQPTSSGHTGILIMSAGGGGSSAPGLHMGGVGGGWSATDNPRSVGGENGYTLLPGGQTTDQAGNGFGGLDDGSKFQGANGGGGGYYGGGGRINQVGQGGGSGGSSFVDASVLNIINGPANGNAGSISLVFMGNA